MNIYQKLIEVRKAVPYLKKENEGYQFKFVSSSQTLASLKKKMDELQVLLVPSITSKNLFEKTLTGAKEHLTEIEIDYTWINAEEPNEKITCHWYGQGLDTGEKGVGKALTYAEKYFMLKFFNIPTDKDDPDSFQDKVDGKNVKGHKAGDQTILKKKLMEQYKGDKAKAKAEFDKIMALQEQEDIAATEKELEKELENERI